MDPSEFAECQHCVIAGHNELRARGESAFHDSIVRFVRKQGNRFDRFNDVAEIGEKDGDTGQFFAVTSELVGENGEEFIKDGARKSERVFTLDDSPKRLSAASVRQGKGRHEHVRVEDDPHARRYRCKSASVRMARSFARRLQ